MNIRIRPATARDLAFVHRDKEIPAAAMRRMVREGDVFVALAGPRRVGLARLEYLWGKTPFLTSLWVEPRWRRRGIAFYLLVYIERMLARRGQEHLYSSTIPENKAGLAWHRSLRFERIGYIDKINPDGGGEVFFRKQLRKPLI